MESVFVIKDGDKFVQLDMASGGYPHLVEEAYRAKFFVHENDAEKYLNMFKKSSTGAYVNWEIYKLKFSLEAR